MMIEMKKKITLNRLYCITEIYRRTVTTLLEDSIPVSMQTSTVYNKEPMP